MGTLCYQKCCSTNWVTAHSVERLLAVHSLIRWMRSVMWIEINRRFERKKAGGDGEEGEGQGGDGGRSR